MKWIVLQHCNLYYTLIVIKISKKIKINYKMVNLSSGTDILIQTKVFNWNT
jgi:hypothetical protein